MLPFPKFRLRHSLPHPQLPSASVQDLPVPASCARHFHRSARHCSTRDSSSILPPVTSHASPVTNSFRIRTYEKRVRNPFGIRTSKTQHLKPFRMNTSKKTVVGSPPSSQNLHSLVLNSCRPCLRRASQGAAVFSPSRDTGCGTRVTQPGARVTSDLSQVLSSLPLTAAYRADVCSSHKIRSEFSNSARRPLPRGWLRRWHRSNSSCSIRQAPLSPRSRPPNNDSGIARTTRFPCTRLPANSPVSGPRPIRFSLGQDARDRDAIPSCSRSHFLRHDNRCPWIFSPDRQVCCAHRQERTPHSRADGPSATARKTAAGARFRRVHSRSEFSCTHCAPSHRSFLAATSAAVPRCKRWSRARASPRRFARNNTRGKPPRTLAPPPAAKRSARSANPFRAANAGHVFPECQRAASRFPSIAECPRESRLRSILPTSARAFPGRERPSRQGPGSLRANHSRFLACVGKSFFIPPRRREFYSRAVKSAS